MIGKKLALVVVGTASGILGRASGACTDNTSCLKCAADTDCLWCQSNTDYFAGQCTASADGTCNTTSYFPVNATTNSDSCPFQSGGCTDCVANGGAWGVTDSLGKCYWSSTDCGEGCVTSCPSDASADSSATNQPTTPEPTSGEDGDTVDDKCSEYTFCMTCPTADCVWCQSNSDYFTGNCVSTSKACDASTEFKVTLDSNADSCPFQSEKCADCVANGGEWGVYAVDEATVGRCFLDATTCAASTEDISCTATCPEENNTANSQFGPATPAPDSASFTAAALFTTAAATAAALALF